MVSTASKISFSRRSLFFGIVVVITTTTSIIIFANVEAREHHSHWIISISASATAVLAFSTTITMHNKGNDTSIQLVEDLKAAIMKFANSYYGVTGNTSLNRMGDGAEGDYDCWHVTANAVESKMPTFSWNRTTN
jgi:hypothetical protein